MVLDTLAKYYALKRVNRLRRIMNGKSLSIFEKYGFQLHLDHLTYIGRALEDGWPQYYQLVKANASDGRLRTTVTTISDEVKTTRMGIKELAVEWVDAPVQALTVASSPLMSMMNIVLSVVSILGLRSLVKRRAIRRLMEPLNSSPASNH